MAHTPSEIIGSLMTIGDELLLGDIPNGNAHYIAYELRSKGFRLGRMVTTGDAEEGIVQELSDLLPRSRFLIITGGLGPTSDDRTADAVTNAFHRPLVPNPPYEQWLRDYVARRGRPWSEALEKMSRLPEGAVKLGLPMAGFFLEQEGVPCFFLPGVPDEMKTLLREQVIPELEKRFPERPVYLKRVLRIQGLTESQINPCLKDLERQDTGVAIGYLPQGVENWVTLLAAAENEETAQAQISRVEQEVVARLGDRHVSGRDGESIEVVIGRLLREKNWKIAAAESCTGGLLSRKITAVSGASDYFDRAFITYSNEAKTELLGVSEALLRDHGAVSEPVARAMAEGACSRAHVDVALAITGIAGPSGGSPEKPVGTVFIACAVCEQSTVEKHLFRGTREQIQEKSAHAALVLLWRMLCR